MPLQIERDVVFLRRPREGGGDAGGAGRGGSVGDVPSGKGVMVLGRVTRGNRGDGRAVDGHGVAADGDRGAIGDGGDAGGTDGAVPRAACGHAERNGILPGRLRERSGYGPRARNGPGNIAPRIKSIREFVGGRVRSRGDGRPVNGHFVTVDGDCRSVRHARDT